MDIQKQVDYWRTGAEEDFAAAQPLLEKGYLRHCLFFVHLALEKMLKAHVAAKTKDVPPRIHNLVRLAQLARLGLDREQEFFLRRFDVYQMEGRYPDSQQVSINLKIAQEEIQKAKEMLEWLKAQLPVR
jgi:HEPN domain-containing protein